jgi:hypothetical protein
MSHRMVLETRGGVLGGKGRAGDGRETEPDWVVDAKLQSLSTCMHRLLSLKPALE